MTFIPSTIKYVSFWDLTSENRYLIFKGTWDVLPMPCIGNVEVMDQTIGCDECGMNLWYCPEGSQASGMDFELFDLVHPFQFEHGHDPGDAHDWNWGPDAQSPGIEPAAQVLLDLYYACSPAGRWPVEEWGKP